MASPAPPSPATPMTPGTPNPAAHTNTVLARTLGVTFGGANARPVAGAVELPRLAEEIAKEEGTATTEPVLLSGDNVERALMERLGFDDAALATAAAGGASVPVSPFQYLLGCFRRSFDEDRISDRLKDKDYVATLKATLASVRELCVSYAGMLMQYPDMFPQPQACSNAGALQLLDAMTGEGAFTKQAQQEALPGGFLEALTARFADEGVAEMMGPIFDALPKQIHSCSILGPYQSTLGTLCQLSSNPALASLLTQSPAFSPTYRNGREFELKSVLGAFLRLSPLPDFWSMSAQPNVAEASFPNPSKLSQRDANAAFGSLRTTTDLLHSGLFELVRGLLKGKGNRDRVVGMLAEAIKACQGRSKMRFNEMQEASHGFAFNLAAIMLRLAEPFLDAQHSKRDRLDANYVLNDARGIPFSSETKLAATSEEVAKWVDVRNLDHQEKFKAQQAELERRELEKQGMSAEQIEAAMAAREAGGQGAGPSSGGAVAAQAASAEFSFICECFFLTAEALHLGLIRVIGTYTEEAKEAHRRRDELDAAEERLGAMAAADPNLEALRAQCGRDLQRRLCFDAALQTPDVLSRALAFYRLMVVWLRDLCGGSGVEGDQLPLPPPEVFRAMPEHFVEDMAETLLFVGRLMSYGYLRELGSERLDEFMDFLVVFSGSPLHIKNPYLRAKLIEVLAAWMPDSGDDSGATGRRRRRGNAPVASFASSLFEAHPTAIKLLVPNLVKLYVQIEFTGSHTAFFEKFTIRNNMAQLFEYLWTVPAHRATWKAFAAAESGEDGQYIGFINMLLNDLIYLLDEGMKKIPLIREFENELANPNSDFHRLPQAEREEREKTHRDNEQYARGDFGLASEYVNLLRYTSAEITDALLSESMVARVGSTLNYFLLMLVDPTERRKYRVKDPSKYDFNPQQLLGDIVQIYSNITKDDSEGRFARAVGTDERSFRAPLLLEAASLTRRLGTAPPAAADSLEGLRERALEAVAEDEELDDILGDDIPDEYLDPMMAEIMRDPVKLPTSGNVMDRKHIMRHLLSDETDPFNRKLLTAKMLEPMDELRKDIEAYIAQAKAKAKRAKGADGEPMDVA